MFVSLLVSKGYRYQASHPLYSVQILKMQEPRMAKESWMPIVKSTNLLSIFAFLERLGTPPELFFMILVSWPVNTHSPVIHSVFLNELPLRRIMSGSSGYFVPSFNTILPSNLYRYSFGVSHSILEPMSFDRVPSAPYPSNN